MYQHSTPEIAERIIQEIRILIDNEVPKIELNEKSRFREDLFFDSLKVIVLFNRLETIFDIVFEPTEFADIKKIEDLTNCVVDKLSFIE